MPPEESNKGDGPDNPCDGGETTSGGLNYRRKEIHVPKIVTPRWRAANAHKDNCCRIHGCKWSEKDCPVVAGTVRPGPCRICLDMKSPTPAAYEAACRALWKHREGEEKLEKLNILLTKKNKSLRDEIRLLKRRAAAARRAETRAF